MSSGLVIQHSGSRSFPLDRFHFPGKLCWCFIHSEWTEHKVDKLFGGSILGMDLLFIHIYRHVGQIIVVNELLRLPIVRKKVISHNIAEMKTFWLKGSSYFHCDLPGSGRYRHQPNRNLRMVNVIEFQVSIFLVYSFCKITKIYSILSIFTYYCRKVYWFRPPVIKLDLYQISEHFI